MAIILQDLINQKIKFIFQRRIDKRVILIPKMSVKSKFD